MTAERRADAERLARACAGDRVALTDLYERHVDALWSFVIYRVGRDAELCEDVVQETFLLALERGPSFEPERGSFARAWIAPHSATRCSHARRRATSCR
jgi:DNA-directed RNA polymerase specialized sigma24 family protein